MCKSVKRFLSDFRVQENCPLVNSLIQEDWNEVSSFFRRVREDQDVHRFIGVKDADFNKYALDVMVLNDLVAVAPRVRRVLPVHDYVEQVRPRVRIPTSMVMPVVVGMLAILCALFVLVNMVGTGPRYEKKAEESSLEAQLKLALDEKAQLMDTILARLDDFDTRLTSVQGSHAHVDAYRTQKLDEAVAAVYKKGDTLAQEVTKNVQDKIASAEKNAENLFKQFAINKVATDALTLSLGIEKAKADAIKTDTKKMQDAIEPLKTQLNQVDTRSNDMNVKIDRMSDDLNNNFFVYVSLLALVVIFCGAVTCYVKSSVVFMDNSIFNFHKKYDDNFELLTGSHSRFKIIEDRLEALEDSFAGGRAPPAALESVDDNQEAAAPPAGPVRAGRAGRAGRGGRGGN